MNHLALNLSPRTLPIGPVHTRFSAQSTLRLLVFPLFLGVLLAGCGPQQPPAPEGPTMSVEEERAAVSAHLDALHEAAANAQFDRYFGLYTEDAVFMGTDATERWNLDQFKGYAEVPFGEGRGWTYTMTERNVFLGPSLDVAWFDERLQNANFGETRGTGVLVKQNGQWRIAQYNLTIPVPNDLARGLVAQIRAREGQ